MTPQFFDYLIVRLFDGWSFRVETSHLAIEPSHLLFFNREGYALRKDSWLQSKKPSRL